MNIFTLLFVGGPVLLIVSAIIGHFLMSRGPIDLKESKMPQPNADEDKSIQKFFLFSFFTVILSFIIRIMAAGWTFLILWIPLSIVMGLHAGILNGAIKKVPHTKPIYSYLIIVSNLLFFLGFVLQADFDDGSRYVPILFFFFRFSFPYEEGWPDIFNAISVGSFIALLISWILLLTLSNSLLKREKPV